MDKLESSTSTVHGEQNNYCKYLPLCLVETLPGCWNRGLDQCHQPPHRRTPESYIIGLIKQAIIIEANGCYKYETDW